MRNTIVEPRGRMALLYRGGPVLLALMSVLDAGCDFFLGHDLNEKFCRANTGDPQCRQAYPDAAPDVPDAPPTCTASSECAPPTGVCDLAGSRLCVACTLAENPCSGATPACVSNQCAKCTEHAQCSTSNVCLPDGTCADPALDQVAYVRAGETGKMCTQAAPCGTLDDALKINKLYVKMESGTVADNKITSIDGKTVTIFAEHDASLGRTGPGVILEIRNNADVTIYDLKITGATGAVTDPAISILNGGAPKLSLTRVTVDGNQGVGISATAGTLTISQTTVSDNTGGGISASGGTLMVSQSTISLNAGGGISTTGGTLSVSRSNITANPKGGISVGAGGASFDITNNFITYNGTAGGLGASQVGGASLLPNTAGSRFERNTVALNQSDGSIFSGGVTCTGLMVSALGNIAYGNIEGASTTDLTQLRGACHFGNTLARGAIAGDLGFKSPRAGTFDFHLTPASPALVVDAAGACTGLDFDGDTRPSGAACDLGADELTP